MPLPGYTDPYADEAAEIERKRRYAEALRAQSFDPVQPYTVGGQAGPISWTQGAAKMLQGYNAGQAGKAAEEQARALRERVQTDRGADMGLLARVVRGAPATSETIMDEQANGGMGAQATINAPAMEPRKIDESILSQMRSPRGQQLAEALWMQEIARANAPPERVDLGDRIGLLKNGQIVGYLPKGATPDATLRETGANQRHLTPSGSAQLGAQTTLQTHATPSGSALVSAATTRRGQDMTDARASQTLEQGKIPPGYRKTPDGGLEPIPGGPADAKEANKVAEVGKVLNMYVQARNGLLSGLEGSETGPVTGRMPALTSEQQIAAGGVSAMAPVLKQIFRVAGEGTFTDRDQALLLEMVPKRTDSPKAREEKIANIDRIVSAKLGMEVPQRQSPEGGAVRIKGDDDYNKLPKGARYIGPDGVERIK